MKDKKAQFFVILLPLIAFVLFTLSLIMYQYSISFEDRLSEFAAFDRLNSLDLSTQNAIRQIFNAKSNIIIKSPNSLTVSINEALPFSHAALNDSLDSFKAYVESNFDFITLNFNETKKSIPLYIKSHDILYNHTGLSNITVTTSSINSIKGYDVSMYISSNFNTGSCSTTGGAGFDKQFSVSIRTLNNTLFQCSSGTVDFSTGNNVAGVILTNGQRVNIHVTSEGKLDIFAPSGLSVPNITTSIFLVDNYNMPEVVLPNGMININYPSFGISKKGDVKII